MVANAEILGKIQPIDSVSSKKKLLIYGEPGKGKTVFAASAPRPLFLAYPAGEVSSLVNHPALMAQAKVIPVSTWSDMEQIFMALKSGAVPDIDTVVIDTISELHKLQLDEILKRNYERDKNRSRWVPTWPDFNENTQYTRKFVLDFLELPYHIIFTSHMTDTKDDESGKIEIRPYLSPKITSAIYGMMDCVGYMTGTLDKEGNQIRHLQIVGNNRIKAKSRLSSSLPPILTNPVFSDLVPNGNGQKGVDNV